MDELAQAATADRRSSGRTRAERILVLTPTGDDASVMSNILEERGHEVAVVQDLESLASEFDAGAGAAIIASEALLEAPSWTALRELLERQEPWSDMPVLLLAGSGEPELAQATELLGRSGQIVLLERPLGVGTFLTAVDAALRGRRRQYEVRRLLEELAESAETIARAHDEANRAKDEFLATLAHELRSPMTAIRGWIQMLKMGGLAPDETADALSMIDTSTTVQAHIIEDLMDVSRILAGKVMIEPAVIELAPVVKNIVATFLPAASEQDIELTAELPPEPVLVWADGVRLQQIGWNLVSNAIKFTPSGGSVRVALSRENGSAVIRVSDTGQGIAPELLPHVFERYRQAEAVSNRQRRGLGLGLAIVRHLVESHGGRIEAFSEGLGKGSEFVVTLPVRSTPPPD